MTFSSRMLVIASFFGGLLISVAGCGGINAPKLQPEEIAKLALAKYDTNQDGAIADDELDSADCLTSVMDEIDADGDKKITADEISSLVENWLNSSVKIMSLSCTVTLNGEPLDGASVTFEPEDFLGGAVSSASGTTGRLGEATMTSPAAKELGLPDGISYGFYKVRITRDNNEVPAKYNTETTLGHGVSPNARVDVCTFKLKR